LQRSRCLARARAIPRLIVAAVVSLGIGIGANLTMLGVLRAIEFPCPHPDASLRTIDASNTVRGRRIPVSLPDFDDIRRRADLAAIAVSADDDDSPRRGGTGTHRRQRVSGGYFATLGTRAAVGRAFVDAGEVAGGVVLSDRLWREQLNGDPNAVGRLVRLEGEPYTVIGVMPRRFDENVDAWIPLRPDASAARDDRQYTAIARLRPSVTLDAARADLASIAGGLAADHPQTNSGWELTPTPINRLRARESGGGWYQLQAAVGFLLLIAGANIANLLLARAVSRRRELAIRTALGATRWQRFRLVYAEGLALAALATALGGALSFWGTRAVTALAELPASVHVPLDALTVGAALLLAVLVSLVISAAPAVMAARIDGHTALRESGTRASASLGQRRLRTLLL
jgi:hypothetical protein